MANGNPDTRVKVITVCDIQNPQGDVRELNISPQVISGEVSTNILKNDAHRTLPEGMPYILQTLPLVAEYVSDTAPPGSYYSPLAENFHQHVTRKPGTSRPQDHQSGGRLF